ncbi:MAG: hypothetical protein D6753_15105, partial [Planctomycetota bacterium]
MVDSAHSIENTKGGESMNSSRVRTSLWATVAAFGTYFCMHGFRKPFTAATWDADPVGPWEFKTALVTSHILGYMLAKVVGVRFVSELPRGYRAGATGMLLVAAHASLLLFALVPAPWATGFMFLNGLALGLIFGLVIGFLEGRRWTEAMAAGLCASFIVAGGFSKSVGTWVLQQGIPEVWMPFVAGTLFVMPTALFVWMLSVVPQPDAQDEALRSPRPEMTALDRAALWRAYWPGLICLFGVFLLVTVVRSMRDDFAPEIWQGLGVEITPALYTWTDSLIAVTVLILMASGTLIRDNYRALAANLILSACGLSVVLLGFALWQWQRAGGIAIMLLIGWGLYLPYVAMHTSIFERLIAATRCRANVGFFIYFADSIGYIGYIAFMLIRPAIQSTSDSADILRYFMTGTSVVAVLG